MATGGTLVLTGANSVAGTDIDVDFVDATGSADSLNVTVQVSTANLDFGTIDISGIESLALTATDTSTTAAIDVATIAVTDTKLTSVTLSGNASVVLTAGAAVTTINGSAMTGKLTAGSNTVATAITGGAGADTLTANVQGDTLNGGAGNDTLIVAANLVTLTGGAGSDIFDVSSARSNSNSYATIADLAAGDKIKTEAAIDNFASTAVSLASTASFGDYVNAAVVAGGANGAAWFQFGGDTYLVHNVGTADTAFTNGTDIIAKIAGTYNLATAALNTDSNWLVVG
jgi:S-layer protein